MDELPGVQSVLQMLLIKRWVKKITEKIEQTLRYITDLCICCSFSISLCFRGFRLFTPQQYGHQERGWGVIISMEMTVQRHAKQKWEEVGSQQLGSCSKV